MVVIIIEKSAPVNAEYGANNPEPLEYKESAVTRNEAYDALDTALEYINGPDSNKRPDIT